MLKKWFAPGFTFVTATVLLTAACEKTTPSNPAAPAVTPEEAFLMNPKTSAEKLVSYNLHEGCPTHKHEFVSGEELCVGLQQSAWNGGCSDSESQEKRKKIFDEFCSADQWNPTRAETDWDQAKDKMECWVGIPDASFHEVATGQKYLNAQGTRGNELTLYHDLFKAVAKRGISRGKPYLVVWLLDHKDHILAHQWVEIDSVNGAEIKIENQAAKAAVRCVSTSLGG